MGIGICVSSIYFVKNDFLWVGENQGPLTIYMNGAKAGFYNEMEEAS